jgi:hypothetical protein
MDWKREYNFLMAHFAELDESNIVTQVIVVHNNELLDNGVESEAKGIAFCQSLFGGNWIQTSYNDNVRGVYAGIGYSYNSDEDIFVSPQPFPSWIRSGSFWSAPIPNPSTEGDIYVWDEDTVSWVKPTEEE